MDRKRCKVTLDVNDGNPSLKSMIRQSGLGKRRWYALHAGEKIDLGNG